jgi:arylsulfatase A-like enzyme
MKPLIVIQVAIGILLTSACSDSEEIKQERPNILVLLSDDHALDAISAYGGDLARYMPTPNIDRIARNGMLFKNCFSISSICCPSRATILTGKTSNVHGVKKVIHGIEPGSDTEVPFNVMNEQCVRDNLGRLLQDAGYHTGVVGKWHAGFDPAAGFNQYSVFPSFGNYYGPAFVENAENGAKSWRYFGEDEFAGDVITDYTISYLQSRKADEKPFVFFCNFWAVHGPWDNKREYDSLLAETELPVPVNFYDDYEGRNPSMKTSWFHIGRRRDMSPVDKYDHERYGDNIQGNKLKYANYQYLFKKYMRCVRGLDNNIGMILDFLEESGMGKNTIVIYASDQGFFTGQHGFHDKRWIYEESIRMPLMVQWDDVIEPGTVNNDMVLNLDFAQTILDLTGVEEASGMQGRSFKPLLLGQKADDWRTSFYYHYYGGCDIEYHYGIRTNNYKLAYFRDSDFWELYNLETDPNEMHNLYYYPYTDAIVKDMKIELEKLRKEYGFNNEY